jgi:flagellar hook assembly protein FlgD
VNGGTMPKEFALSQNYPNPFNPSTKLEVSLPQAAYLDVAVYNILGQKVTTLVNEMRDAGYQTVTWNGTTQGGTNVASGIYFVRMNATPVSGGEGFNAVRKIMLMK